MTSPVVAPVRSPSFSLAGRSVLVTGGSGAFGHAFVARCLADGVRRVVVFSRCEAKQAEMRAALNDSRVRFAIGDVRDYPRVLDACRGVDTVIHAAALKRVETCESEPAEAIATNVTGTLNVARACIERGVERAVFLSTDKAAAPATLYGMTKATAERMWCSANVYAAGTPTRFAATRYGNVLGSTGSVVPIWKAQKAKGVPVSLTDATCSRFWMTMAQAVDLVLLALSEMRGGDVFVPKVGASSILDLARAIAETDGPYAPGHTESGLRPGEKLHELLVTADESLRTYDCGGHFVIEPTDRTWGDVGPASGTLVPAGFEYRSDRGTPPLSVVELREMAA